MGTSLILKQGNLEIHELPEDELEVHQEIIKQPASDLQPETSNEYQDMQLASEPGKEDLPDGADEGSKHENSSDDEDDGSDSEFERIEKEVEEEVSSQPPSLPHKRQGHSQSKATSSSEQSELSSEHSDAQSVRSKPSSETPAPTSSTSLPSSAPISPTASRKSQDRGSKSKSPYVASKTLENESISPSGSSRRTPTAGPRSTPEREKGCVSPARRSSSKGKERLECPTEDPIISGYLFQIFYKPC